MRWKHQGTSLIRMVECAHHLKGTNAIENMQKFIARVITHEWKSDYPSLYSKLNWQTLNIRRKIQKLKVYYNILSIIPATTFTPHLTTPIPQTPSLKIHIPAPMHISFRFFLCQCYPFMELTSSLCCKITLFVYPITVYPSFISIYPLYFSIFIINPLLHVSSKRIFRFLF